MDKRHGAYDAGEAMSHLPSAERPNLGELREQLIERIETLNNSKDGTSRLADFIEQREREAAEGIAKQACHMAENHYGYACLELRNLWDRLAKLKSQPKEGGK